MLVSFPVPELLVLVSSSLPLYPGLLLTTVLGEIGPIVFQVTGKALTCFHYYEWA